MLESQIKWSWGTPHPPPMCTIMFYDVLNRLGATEVDPAGENHKKSSKIHEISSKSIKILQIQAKSRIFIENRIFFSSSPNGPPGGCLEPSHRLIMFQ